MAEQSGNNVGGPQAQPVGETRKRSAATGNTDLSMRINIAVNGADKAKCYTVAIGQSIGDVMRDYKIDTKGCEIKVSGNEMSKTDILTGEHAGAIITVNRENAASGPK